MRAQAVCETRLAGALLHVTSLPGPGAVGDLGPEARRFIDWLHAAELRLWQVLPISPPERGDSPYSSYSSFAGNPLLISLEQLAEEGLLTPAEAADAPDSPEGRADFALARAWKGGRLRRAFERFKSRGPAALRRDFEAYCAAPEQRDWLDDYCLFAAIKQEQGGAVWTRWPSPLARRDAAALERWARGHKDEISFQRFVQFLFDRQWDALRAYAAGKRVRLVGDLPIYVAHDSADVWTHPELFKLDARGEATLIAGAPPDYFSPTGQLWDMPVYDWRAHADSGFNWWRRRVKAGLRRFDALRLDHFRGFVAFWETPAGHKDATRGRWSEGPGKALFDAIAQDQPLDRLFAENLGSIMEDVEALRAELGLPGVHVLQFAFAPRAPGEDAPDPANPNLPYNHERRAVVYTGTHDNDTTRGWYERASEMERHIARVYLSVDGGLIHWDMTRAAFGSVARWAIAPVQDILGLGTEARMNIPGLAEGNWGWRLTADQLTPQAQEAVAKIARFYGRVEREDAAA